MLAVDQLELLLEFSFTTWMNLPPHRQCRSLALVHLTMIRQAWWQINTIRRIDNSVRIQPGPFEWMHPSPIGMAWKRNFLVLLWTRMGQHYWEGLLTATFSFGGVSKAKNVGNIHYRHEWIKLYFTKWSRPRRIEITITTLKSETVININLKQIISFEIEAYIYIYIYIHAYAHKQFVN